jgi:hypothetical protein
MDAIKEEVFKAKYADIFGISSDFTAKPVVARPKPSVRAMQIQAVQPDRDALKIVFPYVEAGDGLR